MECGFFIFRITLVWKEVIYMQMSFHRKIPIPQEVKKEFPLTKCMEAVKAECDQQIRFPIR